MGRMMYRGGAGGNMGGVPGGDINRAKLALQSNRPDEAERLLRKRLDRKSDDSASRLLLAQALVQQQRIEEAVREARRVVREQPTNADAYLVLSAGLTQQRTSRSLQEAEDAARRAVQLQPKQGRARVQLAEVLAARNKLKDAREQADEAARLEPRLAAAHLIRGMVMLADKDYAGAVTASESALRYDKSLFPAHFTLANALIEVKRYDEGLSELEQARTLNPMLPAGTVHGLRGRVYLKQRKIMPAYHEFVTAHRSAGRLTWFAPISGVLQFAQVFGPYGPPVAIMVILLLILFGIGFIPVVGPWLATVIVLAVLAVSFFGAIRQYQGSIFASGARIISIAATVVAFALVVGGAVWASSAIVPAIVGAHARGNWFSPVVLFITVTLGLAAGAGADYATHRWGDRLGRFEPRTRAAAS